MKTVYDDVNEKFICPSLLNELQSSVQGHTDQPVGLPELAREQGRPHGDAADLVSPPGELRCPARGREVRRQEALPPMRTRRRKLVSETQSDVNTTLDGSTHPG